MGTKARHVLLNIRNLGIDVQLCWVPAHIGIKCQDSKIGPAHRQPACSVRVALCTCCALCAIKHMTQKHWCVRAAREREEGVKTHRYAVLKGCWERDIVRPPTPVQITPELPTVTVFYSRVARHLVGSREKQCGDDLNTAVTSHYRGKAVIVTVLPLTTLIIIWVCLFLGSFVPLFNTDSLQI